MSYALLALLAAISGTCAAVTLALTKRTAVRITSVFILAVNVIAIIRYGTSAL